VRTRGDGIFFVPAAQLGAPPEMAELIVGGIRQRPLQADASGIWFYLPAYADPYTATNAAFIAASGRRVRPIHKPARPVDLFAASAQTTFTATATAEEDLLYTNAATGAPDAWFYDTFLSDGSPEQVVSLDVPGLATGATTLRVAVFGYTQDDAIAPDHELIVAVNGQAVGDLTWDGRGYRILEISLSEGLIQDGANTVGLLTPASAAIPNGHGVVLDYVQLEYTRRLSVAGGPVQFTAGSLKVVEVGPLPAPELLIAEIRDRGRTRALPGAFQDIGGQYVCRFQARQGGGTYYVARPDQVLAPEEIAAAMTIQIPARIDYVAVGPAALRAAAQPLLDAHAAAGLRPLYVSLAAAIDTFGYGRYGAAAIVNLVRDVRPRYLLLVGDNSYDYRGREGLGIDPMVPSVLTATVSLGQANTDALFGDTNGDGTPDIPVGRLPVRTAAELDRLVAKIMAHGVSASGLVGALVADDADAAGDFAAAQDQIALSHTSVTWLKMYLGIHGDAAWVRSALTSAVNSGYAEFVVYQGHGSSGKLAQDDNLLDVSAAATWTGVPVVYLSTCWGAYIQQNTTGAVTIAETLLRSQTGAPALIGSTAPCTQQQQAALLDEFLTGALQSGTTLGDALVAAQQMAAARAAGAGSEESRGQILETLRTYTVLGDPAMPLIPSASQDPPPIIGQ
jgi:hypothetical protein